MPDLVGFVVDRMARFGVTFGGPEIKGQNMEASLCLQGHHHGLVFRPSARLLVRGETAVENEQQFPTAKPPVEHVRCQPAWSLAGLKDLYLFFLLALTRSLLLIFEKFVSGLALEASPGYWGSSSNPGALYALVQSDMFLFYRSI